MVLLHETGQLADVTVHEVALSPVMPSAELNTVNPAGKIPALRLADGSHLHDSRVIFEYLDQRHAGPSLIPKGPQRWDCLTLASLADAALDAAILIRYETFLRPADKRWDAWQQGQQDKVERALAGFERAIDSELDSHFNLAAISVACALGYIDLRQPELDWRQRYPQLTSWYAGISQRPSLLATQPPR
jgi:glutathione S-transferase